MLFGGNYSSIQLNIEAGLTYRSGPKMLVNFVMSYLIFPPYEKTQTISKACTSRWGVVSLG